MIKFIFNMLAVTEMAYLVLGREDDVGRFGFGRSSTM